MIADLPKPILTCVRRFEARRWWFILLRAFGWAAACAMAFTLMACMIDRGLRLSSNVRATLLAMDLLLLVIILAWPLRPILRGRRGWLQAAADIERVNPHFAQRLSTVISQATEKPEYRGSPQMLQRLVEDVSELCRKPAGASAPPRRAIALPWLAVVALSALMAALTLPAALGLPTLLARFLHPYAPIPPVTTTQLQVNPGDTTIDLGSPLAISAVVQRLGTQQAEIFTSYDGTNWSRIGMLPLSDSEHQFTLDNMTRDLRYYVVAGDAVSPVYNVTVSRPPAIAQFKLHYEYPPHTHLQPLALTNTDGTIEGPTGTRVTLSVVAAEPLASGLLVRGDEKQSVLTGTAEPNVLAVTFQLRRSMQASLQLVSHNGLSSTHPLALRVHADREPQVRLLLPAHDLRLGPRDIVPLAYQALDDYGIVSLSLSVVVNSASAKSFLLSNRSADGYGQYHLDLSALSVDIGDMVTVSLVAQDGVAKRKTASEPAYILISPRSIDLPTHQRLLELKQARHLAAKLMQELDRSSGAPSSGNPLASALESSLLLHQSLLRSIAITAAKDHPQLATLVDRARVLSVEIDGLLNRPAGLPAGNPESAPPNSLAQFLSAARSLASDVTLAADAAQARALLADRENLRLTSTSATDRLREARRRAMADVERSLRELRLDPSAPDLDSQLQALVQRAEALASRADPIDFAGAAANWSAAVQRGDPFIPPLSQRLLSASAVEAVRPDGDPAWAFDLHLAAKVAARLSSPSLAERIAPDSLRQALEAFQAALAALQREHAAPGDRAVEARARLADWASISTAMEPEELALQGNLLTAQREFDVAAAVDARLASISPDKEYARDIDRLLQQAESISAVQRRQAELSQQTAAADGAALRDLLIQQTRHAEDLAALQRAARASSDGNIDPKLRLTAASPEQRKENQQRLLDHDPLLLAHWHAEAAARALAATPANLPLAQEHQTSAALSLAQAWRRALREISFHRLSAAPTFRSIVAAARPGADLDGLAQLLPALREWTLLEHRGTDSHLPPHESEPGGYQEPLRLYFEALSKVRQTEPTTRPK